MPTRLLIAAFVLAAGAASPLPAVAQQSMTPMETGLRIAMRRGVPDPHCYATVFARFAVYGMRKNGTPGWRVEGSPAYNNAIERTCGVDRPSLVRAERRMARRKIFGLL